MFIGGTGSVAKSLRRMKKVLLCAHPPCRSGKHSILATRSGFDSRRLAKLNIDHRQPRFVAIISSYYLNLDIGAISGADRNRLGQLPAGECFLRHSDSQGAVWPMAVVPIRKVIQPALDGRGAHSRQREPLPLLETFEESLHPAVQKWTSDARSHMADSLPPHRFSELFSELRSIVSDDGFRSAMPGGGAAHQRDHIPCARRSSVHFQSQNLARKSVKYGRDEKGEPQNTNLRDVGMPNVIGLLRFQQVMRLDASGFFHRGSCFSRRLSRFRFPQHPLDAGPADLNSSAQQVPGHGAGSEFRFRAEPSQFLRRPAYGVIHAIPDDGPGQQARLAAALDGFNPCAERIFVDHEPLGGVFDIPVPQSHDLQNGQPLGGAVIGPLLWQHVLPPRAENIQFPPEQVGFSNFMIPLDHQSHKRRRGGSHARPRQLRSSAPSAGHGISNARTGG